MKSRSDDEKRAVPATFTAKLSVHHVGGRNGSRSFPNVPAFEQDLINVLYDADTDSIDHARERNEGLRSELHVLPYCLAESCGKIPFYLNRDPFTSSNLKGNPAYASYYMFSGGNFTKDDHDYPFGEAASPVETRMIDAVNLDSLYRSGTLAAAPPDFLSIDTQGSEFAILRGAEETLKGVLALCVEVEFHPLYEGQKLFGDLSRWLTEKGFHFVGFPDLTTMSPHRSPVGLRGGGFLVGADAVFLRSADDLERSGLEPAVLRARLRKLAFISVLHNQLEYALECLHRVKPAASPAPAGSVCAYERFLDEFEACAANVPDAYPPTFGEKYTKSDSLARFETAASLAAKQSGTLKGFLKALPLVGPALGWAKKHLMRAQRFTSRWREWPLLKTRSDVEFLLDRYGLREQSQLVWRKRVAQSASARLAKKSTAPNEVPLQ